MRRSPTVYPPGELLPFAETGRRALVPFGPRLLTGFILGVSGEPGDLAAERIKQSNGYITMESELGKGSVCRIYLPRESEEMEPAKFVGATHEVAAGDESVLLVEDEASLRNIITRALTGAWIPCDRGRQRRGSSIYDRQVWY